MCNKIKPLFMTLKKAKNRGSMYYLEAFATKSSFDNASFSKVSAIVLTSQFSSVFFERSIVSVADIDKHFIFIRLHCRKWKFFSMFIK